MKRWSKGATDELLFSDTDRRVVIRKKMNALGAGHLTWHRLVLVHIVASRISYIEFCTLTYSSTHLQY
jgi:hypothetical protein